MSKVENNLKVIGLSGVLFYLYVLFYGSLLMKIILGALFAIVIGLVLYLKLSEKGG